MAENSDAFCRALAGYIAVHTGNTVEYIDGIPWQEREQLFDEGEIELLWICGPPYVLKVDSRENNVELLGGAGPYGRAILSQTCIFFRCYCSEHESIPLISRVARHPMGI